MLARVLSAAVNGFEAFPVEVEVIGGWGVTIVVLLGSPNKSRRYLSACCRISPTTLGLALPLLNFMTWPFKKFSAATLPAL